MRAYVMTTGAVFGLLTLVHVWRAVEEPHLMKDLWFIGISVIAAVLCGWAAALLRRSTRT